MIESKAQAVEELHSIVGRAEHLIEYLTGQGFNVIHRMERDGTVPNVNCPYLGYYAKLLLAREDVSTAMSLLNDAYLGLKYSKEL